MPIKTKAGAELYFKERGVWPKGWEPEKEPEYTKASSLKKLVETGDITPGFADSLAAGIKPFQEQTVPMKEMGIRGLLEKGLMKPEQADSLRAGLQLAKPKSITDILKGERELREEQVEKVKREVVTPEQVVAAEEAEKAEERAEKETKKYEDAFKEYRTLTEKTAKLQTTGTITSNLITPEMIKKQPMMAKLLEVMSGQKLTDEWRTILEKEYSREANYYGNILSSYEKKQKNKEIQNILSKEFPDAKKGTIRYDVLNKQWYRFDGKIWNKVKIRPKI